LIRYRFVCEFSILDRRNRITQRSRPTEEVVVDSCWYLPVKSSVYIGRAPRQSLISLHVREHRFKRLLIGSDERFGPRGGPEIP